jgi:hypothetical protein
LAGVVTGTVGQFREFPVTSSKPESWTRESSQHFLHNVNATIDSSIEISQGARSLIVSWMGSMMVVTNPMVIKCSLLARSQPRIKTRQMAAIQPTTGTMATSKCSFVLHLLPERSARRNDESECLNYGGC